MASLPIALDSTSAEPMALARTETRASDNRCDFDQVERSVILLSRNDPWLSLADPQGRTTRVLRCMGFGAPNRLADARLEALRRHAIILRPGAREEDLQRLLAAGFVAAQAARLEQMVLPWRSRPHPGPGVLC